MRLDLDELDRRHAAAKLDGMRRVVATLPVDGGYDAAVVDSGNIVLIECFEVVSANGFKQPAVARADSIIALHNAWPAVSRELRALRKAVAFFACCIKSGEPWTAECDAALAKAKEATDEP